MSVIGQNSVEKQSTNDGDDDKQVLSQTNNKVMKIDEDYTNDKDVIEVVNYSFICKDN